MKQMVQPMDKVEKARLKLDKAVEKRDRLDAKIPKKKKQRLYEKEKPQSALKFNEDMPKPSAKLLDKPKPYNHVVNAPKKAIKSTIHQETSKDGDDNIGVQSVHSTEKSLEFVAARAKSAYRHHKAKPYNKLQKAENKVVKTGVNYSHKKALAENPQVASNPISRFQQKRAIKQQYASAFRQGGKATTTTIKSTIKQGASAVTKAVGAVLKNPKVLFILGIALVLLIVVMAIFSTMSTMFQGVINQTVATSYTSENEELVAVNDNFTFLETALQNRIDNIESEYSGYDEYRYNLDSIAHDPHQLAAYLTAKYPYFTASEMQAEIESLFNKMYRLTTTQIVETRYRTETRTGSYTTTDEDGNVTTHTYTYEVQVPYDYYILNVKLTSKSVNEIANADLTSEQLEMYNVYRQTLGNKPLLFGGGSINGSPSTDLTGVVFVDGERTGNQAIVNIAMSQVGNIGGQPYWSWYGFDYRVEWCATFVSWVFNQAGYSEPRFAACQSQGIPYYSSMGRWASRGYEHIAAGDAIFFDWEGDGSSDHVGIVIGTDGNKVYTVEGNSGDACKIRSYDLNSSVIKGYGLMN